MSWTGIPINTASSCRVRIWRFYRPSSYWQTCRTLSFCSPGISPTKSWNSRPNTGSEAENSSYRFRRYVSFRLLKLRIMHTKETAPPGVLNNNRDVCPNCESGQMQTFYEVRNIPVHSVLLMSTPERALNYP